jgi:hypothetical protein
MPEGKGQESSQNDQKIVNVLSNLNITMCHAFIKDQNWMPLPINLSYYLFDDQSTMNNQDIIE